MTDDTQPSLIVAVDQGTSSTRVLVIDSKTGLPITFDQEETVRITPREGWTEMDPMWIIESVEKGMEACVRNLREKNIDLGRIKCIGITNQMVTLTAWDKTTGKPFYNSIVWMDNRTHLDNEKALDKLPDRNIDHFRARTGMPLSTIFWYTKLPWVIENIPEVKTAIEEGKCMIGTVDTWLLWNLTGGPDGGIHVTDPTNASCTGLLNINDIVWDEEVCKFFNIPMNLLAEIRSSSEIYGYMKKGSLSGIPISAVIGDQLGATTGQLCFDPGQCKCTYGTAGCLNVNTGSKPVYSSKGMMTMPLLQLGPKAPTYYCLQGPMPGCGVVIRWLRDNLEFFKESKDIEQLAASVDSTHDCYFVPAFVGLFSPYWADHARGTIVGMTTYTRKEHLCRAALEAICFMMQGIVEATLDDTSFPLKEFYVDGGMVENDLLMQMQADILGYNVYRPNFKECTALGAALMAGAAEGIDIYKVTEDRRGVDVTFPRNVDVFKPKISSEERLKRIARFNMAVEKAKHWISS